MCHLEHGTLLAQGSTKGIAPRKRDSKMKHIGLMASLIILCASFAGCIAASDRVLYRRYAGYNYCHMKVETAGDPIVPTEREVIDFYGPCDAYD
jgi:hypothetical protein